MYEITVLVCLYGFMTTVADIMDHNLDYKKTNSAKMQCIYANELLSMFIWVYLHIGNALDILKMKNSKMIRFKPGAFS